MILRLTLFTSSSFEVSHFHFTVDVMSSWLCCYIFRHDFKKKSIKAIHLNMDISSTVTYGYYIHIHSSCLRCFCNYIMIITLGFMWTIAFTTHADLLSPTPAESLQVEMGHIVRLFDPDRDSGVSLFFSSFTASD